MSLLTPSLAALEHPMFPFIRNLFEPTDTVWFKLIHQTQKHRQMKHGMPVFDNNGQPVMVADTMDKWCLLQDLPASFASDLDEKNADGWNIYVCMNPIDIPMDGSYPRRTKSNVSVIRNVYTEIDENGEAVLDRIRAAISAGEIPSPHIHLQSSPGKHQVIWKVAGLNWREQEALNRALIKFGGDPQSVDCVRVLRLPDFVNQKYAEKPLARVLWTNLDLTPHTLAAFKLPLIVAQDRTKSEPVSDEMIQGRVNKIEDFMSRAGVAFAGLEENTSYKDGGWMWEMNECPNADEHKHGGRGGAVLFIYTDGALNFTCRHTHCVNMRWDWFKAYIESAAGEPLIFRDNDFGKIEMTSVESVTETPISQPASVVPAVPAPSINETPVSDKPSDIVLVFDTIEETILGAKLGFQTTMPIDNAETLRKYKHIVLFGVSEAALKMRNKLDADLPCTSLGLFPPNLAKPKIGYSGKLRYPPCKNLIESRAQFQTDAELEAYLATMLTKGFVTSRSTRQENEYKFVTYADKEMRYQNWIWAGKIPLGALTIFCGDPGTGKNTVIYDNIARVTRGYDFPDGTPNTLGAASVILAEAEDSPETTTAPYLSVAAEDCAVFGGSIGADLKRVIEMPLIRPESVLLKGQRVTFKKRELQLSKDLAEIERMIKARPDVKMIVISPLSAYLGPDINEIATAEVRAVLQPLQRMAEQLHIGVVCIMHLNKSSDLDVIYRVSGSIAFVGVARAVWVFAKDSKDGKRYMVSVKNNLEKPQKGLSFDIKDSQTLIPVRNTLTGAMHQVARGRVYWDGETDKTTEDIMKPAGSQKQSETPAAKVWLQTLFEAESKDGFLPIQNYKKARAMVPFSQYAIDTAKSELGWDYDGSRKGYIQLIEPAKRVSLEKGE